jgi:tetratricopeptide (TPR) repeat protein
MKRARSACWILFATVQVVVVDVARCGGVATSPADAASQATAGVQLRDHQPYSVFFAPQLLGFAERGGFTVGRGFDLRADSLGVDTSLFAWTGTNAGGGWGLALDALERRALRPGVANGESEFLRGSLAWSRVIGQRARASWGQSVGAEYARESSSSEIDVYTVLGFGLRPRSWLYVGQSGTIHSGDRKGDGSSLDWSASSEFRLSIDDLGVRTGIGVRSGSFDADGNAESGVRWALGVEPALLLEDRPWASMLRGTTLDFGAGPEGPVFGATLSVGGLGVSVARSRWSGHSYTALSVSQHWGARWGQPMREASREAIADVTRLLDDVEELVRTGDFDLAHERVSRALADCRYDHLRRKLQSTQEVLEGHRFQLATAGGLYQTEAGYAQAGTIYAALSTLAPQCEEFALRRNVCRLIVDSRTELQGGRTASAREYLEEAFRLDPDHPVVIGTWLRGLEGFELALEGGHLMASLYRSYSGTAPIRAQVRNEYPFPVDIRAVECKAKSYFTGTAREVPLVPVSPNDYLEIELVLTFDPDPLSRIDPSEAIVVEGTAIITAGTSSREIQTSKRMELHGPRVINWRDPRQFGATISAADVDIRRLMVSVPLELQPDAESQMPRLPQPAIIAMGIFHLLRASGVNYGADAPMVVAPGSAAPVFDHLEAPARLLEHKFGDCEDLVAFWLNLLQAFGLETRYVVELGYRGHIMLMVDLQIPPNRASRLCGLARYTLERDGRLWLPIETTVPQSDFLHAVELGFAFMTQLEFEDTRREFVLSEVQKEFPPPVWPSQQLRNPILKHDVQTAVAREIERHGDRIGCGFQKQIWTAQDTAVAKPEQRQAKVKPSCRELTPPGSDFSTSCATDFVMGMRLAMHGEYGPAIPRFESALKCESSRAAALCNLGNLALLVERNATLALEYYDCASSLDPEDDGLRLNVIIAHQVLAFEGVEGSAERAAVVANDLRNRISLEEALMHLGRVMEEPARETTAAPSSDTTDWLVFVEAALRDGRAEVSGKAVTQLGMGEEDAVIYWKEVVLEPH